MLCACVCLGVIISRHSGSRSSQKNAFLALASKFHVFFLFFLIRNLKLSPVPSELTLTIVSFADGSSHKWSFSRKSASHFTPFLAQIHLRKSYTDPPYKQLHGFLAKCRQTHLTNRLCGKWVLGRMWVFLLTAQLVQMSCLKSLREAACCGTVAPKDLLGYGKPTDKPIRKRPDAHDTTLHRCE